MAKILSHINIDNEVLTLGAPMPKQESQNLVNQQELLLDEAYQKGYCSALAEGVTRAEENMIPLKMQLRALLESLPSALEAHKTLMNSTIAEYVLAIVSQLMIQQSCQPEFIKTQVNHLLAQLKPQHVIALHLHPKDIALLEDGSIQFNTNIHQGINIKSDTTLALGGCIIKTKQGILNASIEQQIEHLKQALLDMKQGALYEPSI
jgi:flagellar assembly protein FliH